MTDEVRSLLDRLAQACDLRSDDDFEAYTSAIRQLRGRSDPDILRHMLRCLRDTEAGEIQYELVEACEAFPDDVYVRVLLEEGPYLSEKSPEWLRLLFQSMLNAPRCAEIFESRFQDLSPGLKELYVVLTRDIAADNPKYRRILDRVRSGGQQQV